MGIYSSFGFPDGVTLFGAGRKYSFDVEEPTFGEAEVVVETEMESWFIPALENAYAGSVRVIPVDTGGELRLPDTDFGERTMLAPYMLVCGMLALPNSSTPGWLTSSYGRV